MTIAHPPSRVVELSNGGKVTLRTWTMAQRAELRPRISELLMSLAKLEGGLEGIAAGDLADLFVNAEDEITSIVRESITLEQLPREDWGKMAWEDIPVLAQAVWELNVARPDGALGKVGAGLGGMMASTIEAVLSGAKAGKGKNQSQTLTDLSKTSSRPRASASLPIDGAPTPSA